MHAGSLEEQKKLSVILVLGEGGGGGGESRNLSNFWKQGVFRPLADPKWELIGTLWKSETESSLNSLGIVFFNNILENRFLYPIIFPC